jgi:hypothetical protein
MEGTKGMMKERDPRYTEDEWATIQKAWLYGKMSDDLRAQAEQSRYEREHGPLTKANPQK